MHPSQISQETKRLQLCFDSFTVVFTRNEAATAVSDLIPSSWASQGTTRRDLFLAQLVLHQLAFTCWRVPAGAHLLALTRWLFIVDLQTEPIGINRCFAEIPHRILQSSKCARWRTPAGTHPLARTRWRTFAGAHPLAFSS